MENKMENKQRQQGDNPSHKHPEQDEQNPDQRDRGNRSNEANIDQDNRHPGQQTERQRKRGEAEAVEGEGVTNKRGARR